MIVFVIPIISKPYFKTINDIDILSSLQEIVDGRIEQYHIDRPELTFDEIKKYVKCSDNKLLELIMYCNNEGSIKNLPINRNMSSIGVNIYGNVVVLVSDTSTDINYSLNDDLDIDEFWSYVSVIISP